MVTGLLVLQDRKQMNKSKAKYLKYVNERIDRHCQNLKMSAKHSYPFNMALLKLTIQSFTYDMERAAKEFEQEKANEKT